MKCLSYLKSIYRKFKCTLTHTIKNSRALYQFHVLCPSALLVTKYLCL